MKLLNQSKIFCLIFLLTSVVIFITLTNTAFASQVSGVFKFLSLGSGDRGLILCDGILRTTWINQRNNVLSVECTTTSGPITTGEPASANTLTPTIIPTHSHSSGVPTVGSLESPNMVWHLPGAHGDRPSHEHGDAPPVWVKNSGYSPMFDHLGNTPNENTAYWKHTGFKGWSGEFNGVKWYGVFHLDFNPSGHANRFHSYQLWFLDGAGATSHMHGWLDFGTGNGTGPNLRLKCSSKDDIRPIMSVNELGCGIQFESWYGKGGATWTPDIGFNISPNYYAGGDVNNPSVWKSINGKVNNTERRIELSWYTFRSNQRGKFYSTQFGDIVNSPNDALCGSERKIGDRTYKLLCLEQYIAPTLTQISFPGNAVQTKFSGANLELPN